MRWFWVNHEFNVGHVKLEIPVGHAHEEVQAGAEKQDLSGERCLVGVGKWVGNEHTGSIVALELRIGPEGALIFNRIAAAKDCEENQKDCRTRTEPHTRNGQVSVREW